MSGKAEGVQLGYAPRLGIGRCCFGFGDKGHDVEWASGESNILNGCEDELFEEEDHFVWFDGVKNLLQELSTAYNDARIVWSRWRVTICVQRPRYDELKLPGASFPEAINTRDPTSCGITGGRSSVHMRNTLDSASLVRGNKQQQYHIQMDTRLKAR
jgi:hypothetical protein